MGITESMYEVHVIDNKLPEGIVYSLGKEEYEVKYIHSPKNVHNKYVLIQLENGDCISLGKQEQEPEIKTYPIKDIPLDVALKFEKRLYNNVWHVKYPKTLKAEVIRYSHADDEKDQSSEQENNSATKKSRKPKISKVEVLKDYNLKTDYHELLTTHEYEQGKVIDIVEQYNKVAKRNNKPEVKPTIRPVKITKVMTVADQVHPVEFYLRVVGKEIIISSSGTESKLVLKPFKSAEDWVKTPVVRDLISIHYLYRDKTAACEIDAIDIKDKKISSKIVENLAGIYKADKDLTIYEMKAYILYNCSDLLMYLDNSLLKPLSERHSRYTLTEVINPETHDITFGFPLKIKPNSDEEIEPDFIPNIEVQEIKLGIDKNVYINGVKIYECDNYSVKAPENSNYGKVGSIVNYMQTVHHIPLQEIVHDVAENILSDRISELCKSRSVYEYNSKYNYYTNQLTEIEESGGSVYTATFTPIKIRGVKYNVVQSNRSVTLSNAYRNERFIIHLDENIVSKGKAISSESVLGGTVISGGNTVRLQKDDILKMFKNYFEHTGKKESHGIIYWTYLLLNDFHLYRKYHDIELDLFPDTYMTYTIY